MTEIEISLDYLVGKQFTKVEQEKDEKIIFHTENGDIIEMYHSQDCCEYVHIEDINGNLEWLENTPIIHALKKTNSSEYLGKEDDEPESFTYTFYTLRTKKGSVDIRWFGESNGYYSESVDCWLSSEKGEND